MSEEFNKEIATFSLPVPDKSTLTEQDKDLLQLAMDTDHGTPLFKIRHFVGDSQVTKYAKYKQLLIEIRAREEMIEQTLVALEKNKYSIEESKELLETETSPAKIKRLHLELSNNINDMAKTKRRLNMMYTERGHFLTALKEMYANGDAYLEDGTDLKDAINDPVLSEELEARHWTYRLGKQAALDLIAYGNIGTGNLEAISQMTEEQAVKTLQLAMTYSHSVKTSLGIMEKTIIEAIDSGQIPSTLRIDNQKLPKALEEQSNKKQIGS